MKHSPASHDGLPFVGGTLRSCGSGLRFLAKSTLPISRLLAYCSFPLVFKEKLSPDG